MEIYEKAREILTPNAPITDKRLLAGRKRLLSELDDLYNQRGSQVVVVGDRGVGKTSLVINSCISFVCAVVNCSRNLTFDGLAKHILKELKVDIQCVKVVEEKAKRVAGGFKFWGELSAEGAEKVCETRAGFGSLVFDALFLFEVIKTLKKKTVIIIDQFESLPKGRNSTIVEVADFMKCLSDQSTTHKCTLVLVGVAKNTQDLLGQREVIHRCVNEVKVKPLSREDIHDFLLEVEHRTGSAMHDCVKTALSADSLGYPYFVHLVGLYTYQSRHERADRFARGIRNEVRPDDYERGKGIAAGKVYKTNLKKYKDSIDNLNSIEKEVLRHINGLRKKELFIRDLWDSFEKVMNYPIESLRIGFRDLKGKKLIEEDGKVVHFPDPLLRPFLRIQFGLPQENLSGTQLNLFSNSDISDHDI